MELVDDWGAAFVAGAIFAFCTFKMAHLAGHFNLMMTHGMPFYLLFAMKALRGERAIPGYAVAAGVVFGLNYLTSLTYAVFLAIVTVLMALEIIWRERRGAVRHIKTFAVLIGASLPFVLPHLYFALGATSEISRSVVEDDLFKYAVDALAFFSPSPDNPLIGRLSFVEVSSETNSYLGFVAMFLVAAAYFRGRLKDDRLLVFKLIFGVFIVLSMGSTLKVLGNATSVPMPMQLMLYLPDNVNLRAPGRLVIVAMLALSVLSAYGVALFNQRKKWLWVIFLLLAMLEYTQGPIPVVDSTVPEPYAAIASDSDSETVLEVPVFVGSGILTVGGQNYRIMNYQSRHGKRIFGGFLARLGSVAPEFSYMNLPVIRSLIGVDRDTESDDKTLAIDRSAAGSFVRLFGVKHIVIHKDKTKVRKEFIERILSVSTVHDDEHLTVLSTGYTPGDGGIEVDAGMIESVPHFFTGWDNGLKFKNKAFACSLGYKSVLLLNLRADRSYELRLKLFPSGDNGTVRVSPAINGRALKGFSVSSEGEYSISIPAQKGLNGISRLELGYDKASAFGSQVSEEEYSDDSLVNEIGWLWSQELKSLKNVRLSICVESFVLTPGK